MFEVYVERFLITEWKQGCVYKTKSTGCYWKPESEVKANRPGMSGVIYCAANDEFAQNNMTIRKARQ